MKLNAALRKSVIVNKLASVCASLDEYPIVRYAHYTDAERKRGRLPLAEQLAQSLGFYCDSFVVPVLNLSYVRFCSALADRLKTMSKIENGPLANARAPPMRGI
jgi:hypothetical protein